jgi:2-polyprenyl-3-methyl-5-hydroxy-6-metoxy-1,4-benzoquinol methylase
MELVASLIAFSRQRQHLPQSDAVNTSGIEKDRMSTTFSETPVESVKQYWDARPCNLRHSTASVGSRQYFDEVEARKHFVEPHIPSFAEFEKWKGKKVLEIGCGMGTATMCFARAGAQVTAVDLSSKSLELAKQRADVFGLSDRITFYNANAEELSSVVPPEPYDLIYSFGVIHHTPHPERVMEQIRRHFVKPGTTLKLMVYNRYSWKVLWILLTSGRGQFWKSDEWIARYSEAQTGCPITYSYGRKSLAQLIGSGFLIKDMSVDHIFPYRIPDYVQYRYVKEWYWRWMPAALFRALERRYGWHLCATAIAT